MGRRWPAPVPEYGPRDKGNNLIAALLCQATLQYTHKHLSKNWTFPTGLASPAYCAKSIYYCSSLKIKASCLDVMKENIKRQLWLLLAHALFCYTKVRTCKWFTSKPRHVKPTHKPKVCCTKSAKRKNLEFCALFFFKWVFVVLSIQ